MNIKNENSKGDIQELSIEINREDYAEKVETALKKQRRTAQVPGFRPGNAPMGLIKKMYEKSIIADEVNNMMSEALYGYLKDNKLDILLEPLPLESKSSIDFENPNNFVFVYEYALQPNFDINFKELPAVNSFHIIASAEEKNNLIDQLRRRHGEYTTPENIEEEDYVTLNYNNKEGFFFAKDLLENGKKVFIGKKVNDEFNVSLKEVFDDTTLAKFLKITEKDIEVENTYTYDVKITNIGRITPCELNEDFFKKAYPDGSVNNEADLDKAVATQIEDQWKEQTNRQFMNDAIGVLIDHVTISLPDEFIKRYILLTQHEMTKEQLDEKYADYQKSFKWQLIESKIVKDNNISVTEEEVKAYIRNFFKTNYFNNFNEDSIVERLDTLVNDAFKNKEDIKNIYDQLFDGKIQEVLRTQFNTNPKSGSFNDFIASLSGNSDNKEKAAAKKKSTKATSEKAETPKTKAKAAPKTKTTKPKAE